MPRPRDDPQGQRKQPITVFLTPRNIAKLDGYRKDGASRGQVLNRFLDRLKDPPGAPK